MKKNLQIILTTICFALLSSAASAQVASNPPYTIEQSVVAGGGGTSADATGNVYSITGSIGQAITETSSAGGFTIKSGFFTAAPTMPTASMVTVGGRVTTATGRGIRNVLILMTDGNGTLRSAVSGSFGFFRFTDVAAGDTYVFTAKAKRFQFNQPTQALSVTEDITDLNFVAVGTP